MYTRLYSIYKRLKSGYIRQEMEERAREVWSEGKVGEWVDGVVEDNYNDKGVDERIGVVRVWEEARRGDERVDIRSSEGVGMRS